MARDYKHAAARGRRRRLAPRARWVTAAGILLALCAAGAALYYFLHRPAAPNAAGTAAAPPAAAIPRPPAPPQAHPAAPRFEFYTLLPRMEVVITEAELDDANNALPKPEHGGPYVLQAGSFRAYADADALKARLALIGVEAGIQTVIIDDATTWHRVRIGPYDNPKEVKKIRALLNRNHIDFVLLRLGG